MVKPWRKNLYGKFIPTNLIYYSKTFIIKGVRFLMNATKTCMRAFQATCFFKQHFYKQHEAKIRLFWHTRTDLRESSQNWALKPVQKYITNSNRIPNAFLSSRVRSIFRTVLASFEPEQWIYSTYKNRCQSKTFQPIWREYINTTRFARRISFDFQT